MISLNKSRRTVALEPTRIVLGVVPTVKHLQLLANYLRSLALGEEAVQEMILADLHASYDSGSMEEAADALIVLRLFLFAYPAASRAPRRWIDEKPASFPRRNAYSVPLSLSLRSRDASFTGGVRRKKSGGLTPVQ